MRVSCWLVAALLFLTLRSASALTIDELITKNIEARGGLEKLRAIKSLRETGKMQFDSITMAFTGTAKRPSMIRTEVSFQGLTAVTAYDGKVGWRIQPFRGRLDPEKIPEDDVKSLQLAADIDGPLVDYKTKGHTVVYLGTEDVDGTDAHKIKVMLKNGDVRYIFLDPDYYLEIRWLDQSRIRGALEETETDLGNYEKIDGVFFPFSMEEGPKGRPKGQKITIEKVEINPELDDTIFHFPAPAVGNK